MEYQLDFEEIDIHEVERAIELEIVMSSIEAVRLMEVFQGTLVRNLMSRFSKLTEADIMWEDGGEDEAVGHSISKKLVFASDMDWILSVYPDRVEEAMEESWEEVLGGINE